MRYIDTEQVIAAVHRRPLLWKRKHKLYKDKEARENAWQEISNEVLAEYYTSLNAAEKQVAGKRIQQRWRTARDTYIKVKLAEESQPPGSMGSKKKYAFYDILSFLDGAGRKAKRQQYEPIDESSMEESLAKPAQSSAPSPSEPDKKRKNLDNSELELEKEDLAFFQTIQPTLKRFSNYQKMMFRTKILQIIMDMESPPVHEVDVASSTDAASTYEPGTALHDPMTDLLTIKSEMKTADSTDDESD